ncbi:MAG: tRNA epoxyqueuosine(34) reductase QueG [Proteobacteria bacterium]|nr:tRNA epoxyqueuosine(34) reductase QueG [Pseudomonadota bacterium]
MLNKSIQEEGLYPLGIVPLFYSESYDHFRVWLQEGKHAGLHYLEKFDELRKEPEKLLPGSKVAIIVALPYSQGDTWPPADAESSRVAQYARFTDYHKLLKKIGQRLVEKWRQDPEFFGHTFRVLVDSAPILERALAAQTKSSFIGKNACLIHPQQGSFLLLAEILTTYPFEIDEFEKKSECGTCTMCQVECPTGALNKDYVLDSNRCLAYWTIEHRGPIPEEFWPWLSQYYFGCDICQLVCPFNKESKSYQLPIKITPRETPSLFEVATMDQKRYETYFGGTPMTRAKRNGLKRNALIALYVTKDSRLEEALAQVKKDGGFPLEETVAQIRRNPIGL